MRLRVLALPIAVAALAPRAAAAQALVAPQIVEAAPPPYPAGAQGDADVIVELVVDDAGNVGDARVVSGPAEFTAAALASVRAWRFEPARKNGKPTPVRIRVRVSFHAPKRDEALTPTATATATATTTTTTTTTTNVTTTANPRVQEVEVVGVRGVDENGEKLGSSEVRQLPGVFGDPFRAIEVLPGVVPAASGVPFYFIRGSPPGNTGYFLDGIPVPALFHLAVGPSVIHPALISSVDLYAGPVPAKYGRYAGGVIAGSVREPVTDRSHGEATLRLFDAGGLVETPIADGKGSALVAARYGYPALVLPIFAPDTRLSYWDYQGRVTYDVTPRDRLGVFAFGSYDTLSQRQNDGRFAEQIGFTFHRVDLRIDHRLDNSGNLRAAVTVGADRSGQEGLDFYKQLFGARMEVDKPISARVRIRGGWDALYQPYQTDTGKPLVNAQFPSRTTMFAGAWLDASIRPWSWLELVPGVRGDSYTSRSSGASEATQAALDPRIVVRASVTKKVTLVSAAGVAHQPPSTLITLPGMDLGPIAAGLQESRQLSQGIEAKLPASFFGSITGFYDEFSGLADASYSCTTGADEAAIASCSGSYLTGRAYGLEVLIKRALSERVAGLISYTLSRSVRDDPYRFGDAGEVPSRFDRTHVFNLVLTANMGRGWSAGGRLFAYTGSPYSRLFSPLDTSTDLRAIPPYNAQRLDGFTRVDLRLEKRWILASGVRVAFFAEMLNALLSKESVGVTCQWNSTPTVTPDGHIVNVCQQSRVGPIAVPSVGVEASY